MSSTDPNFQRAQARVGTWLRGKWYLDQLIGVGGMAAVFAATHRNGKRGAVKLLHAELCSDATARGRFLREGYVANKVGHPGAVSVLDDDVNEDGTVFLVMELLDGRTVDGLATARPGGRLPPDEVLGIADGLLDVLVAAHAGGIVHRDLKPENLFVTHDGAVHVLDFGIARLHDPCSGSRGTRTGEAFGTPAFMPPEQALGEWSRVDGRTDLWSVGATMFTLLTGKLVHDADTLQKVMLAAMTKPAAPLASVIPEIPREIALVVDRALAFEPKDRWPDAASMQRAVRAARASYVASRAAPPTLVSGGASSGIATHPTVAPVSSEPPTVRLRSGRRGLLFFVLGGAVVIGGAIAIFAGRFLGSSPGTGAAATAESASPAPPPSLGPSSAAAPASAEPAPITVVAPASAQPQPSAAGSSPGASSATAPGAPGATAKAGATSSASKSTGSALVSPASPTASTKASAAPRPTSNPYDRRE